MKIAILGYDVEGRAAYEYYAAQGHEITIRDQSDEVIVPDGANSVLGEGYLDDLNRFDLLVRTAGLPPKVIIDKNPSAAAAVAAKITTQVNELMSVSPTSNIIGITGTKGKGTTSTLVAKMLETAAKRVHLGGNIGIAPLELLKNDIQTDDYLVLELSSFQLIDLKASPHIGVCLMVVPEHLNWHHDNNEYETAKTQLFAHQSASDIAIYYDCSTASERIASAGNGRKIPFYASPGAIVENRSIMIDDQAICRVDEIMLLGEHNWQNVCAAVTAVWQITQDAAALRSVLTSFSGLPHRLELVRELEGVRYYDDSFGTTPETAIVAIEAFDQPKVVILGGSDKGAAYDQLARTVTKNNVRKVLLIGEQADSIRAALENFGFSDFVQGGRDMTEIVAMARSVAQAGDVVLLSTACASFDMFKNYKDRAAQFSSAVQVLV